MTGGTVRAQHFTLRIAAAILILIFRLLHGHLSDLRWWGGRCRGGTHGGMGGGLAKASVSSRSSQDGKIR